MKFKVYVMEEDINIKCDPIIAIEVVEANTPAGAISKSYFKRNRFRYTYKTEIVEENSPVGFLWGEF